MFEVFGYATCFVFAFLFTVLCMVLSRNDTWGETYDPDSPENIATHERMMGHWLQFGFWGGMLGIIYYGTAPRDPLLHSILTTMWQSLGGTAI